MGDLDALSQPSRYGSTPHFLSIVLAILVLACRAVFDDALQRELKALRQRVLNERND